MSEPLPDIDSAEWAWPNFRRDVFQLIAWGYQIVVQEIRQKHLEEDITGLIRKGIKEKLDEDLPPRFQCYFAGNEDPVDDDDDGSLGKKRPRVDILIESGRSRPRKRYRLEAKRCARRTNTISWYAEGITAFLTRLYARDSPEGGLLGLMQSDDTKYWKEELSTKLKNDVSLSCQSPLADVDLTPDLAEMTVSVHQRNDGSPIDLYHAFLDCNP